MHWRRKPRSGPQPQKRRQGLIRRWIFRGLTLAVFASFLWGQLKPLPKGMDVASEVLQVPDEAVDFLYDLTYATPNGRVVEQEIFAQVFDVIDQAKQFVVIDMFLFGTTEIKDGLIDISTELKNKLVHKVKTSNVPIYFITDELNTYYQSTRNPLIEELQDAGVTVIYADLNRVRDANPLCNAPWRLFVKPFGLPKYDGGFLPAFSGEGTVSLRSTCKLLNFKVNHRKLILSESEAIITSANPHTGSSLHSNVGIRVKSTGLVAAMLASEKGVAEFSGGHIPEELDSAPSTGDLQIQYVTERRIEQAVLEALASAQAGDEIKIGMFYFSLRSIVKAVKRAVVRGAEITLVLDANKDAFGREKNGIPNRQVAHELERSGVTVRWYETKGEQFHTKMYIQETAAKTTVILGSANYTRRNIRNFNLEANLVIVAPNDTRFTAEVRSYWDEMVKHTLAYEAYMDPSKARIGLYRFMEWSGCSTF